MESGGLPGRLLLRGSRDRYPISRFLEDAGDGANQKLLVVHDEDGHRQSTPPLVHAEFIATGVEHEAGQRVARGDVDAW